MAIAIVEELWTRIRAAIDDKIAAAQDAADRAEAAAQSASMGVEPDTVGRAHLTPALRGEIDGKAPVSHDHTASQISDATTVGRNVLKASSQATARQAIGAGTSNLTLGTTSSTAAAGNHTHSQYATTAQVEARTPEIRVVSSPELATSPGVLYVVRGVPH